MRPSPHCFIFRPAAIAGALNTSKPGRAAVVLTRTGKRIIPRELLAELSGGSETSALLQSGEDPYNLISALHKAVRNLIPRGVVLSVRMLDSGEDPRS